MSPDHPFRISYNIMTQSATMTPRLLFLPSIMYVSGRRGEVEGSISPVADHQVITVFGGLLGQWKCFPAIFFQADVSVPACSGQDSDHLRHSDDSPS